MPKRFSFLKKGRRSIFRSLHGARDNSQCPEEAMNVTSSQSAVPVPDVIFIFESGNALSKKKQTRIPRTAENATGPKLLLPIVVILG